MPTPSIQKSKRGLDSTMKKDKIAHAKYKKYIDKIRDLHERMIEDMKTHFPYDGTSNRHGLDMDNYGYLKYFLDYMEDALYSDLVGLYQ